MIGNVCVTDKDFCLKDTLTDAQMSCNKPISRYTEDMKKEFKIHQSNDYGVSLEDVGQCKSDYEIKELFHKVTDKFSNELFKSSVDSVLQRIYGKE